MWFCFGTAKQITKTNSNIVCKTPVAWMHLGRYKYSWTEMNSYSQPWKILSRLHLSIAFCVYMLLMWSYTI
jgi:hypothetical protein